MSLDDAIARRKAENQQWADANTADAASLADWRQRTERLFDDFFARMEPAGYPGTTRFKDYRGGRGGGSHAHWSIRRRLSASWHSLWPKRVKGWVLSGNEMLSVDGLIYRRTGHPDGVDGPGQDHSYDGDTDGQTRCALPAPLPRSSRTSSLRAASE